LLQGGGALGAYQAGVYEGLAEFGLVPNWLVGISIGAVNSALITGNPPERRLERLRAFWDRVSAYAPMSVPALLDPLRPMLDHLSAASVAMFGIPGFFTPRVPPPFFAPSGSLEAQSFYDTTPLKGTLEELVDFDLINRGKVRLSLGAVNVRTGELVYFDNRRIKIGPEHVLASGALPPGFPAVCIEGEHYWDGGLVSNSPLNYVWDERPLTTALIVQANLFNAQGELPRNLDETLERAKDIQYSSKVRFNTDHIRSMLELRAALGRVVSKLPASLLANPDIEKIASFHDERPWTIAVLNDRRVSHSGQAKDYEFSRATVNERWSAGLEDVRRSSANIDWMEPTDIGPGVRVYNLPPETPAGK